ncbi:tripartite ATP-independent transporter DctP family solute receptor [Aequitasia blattaphilus]|uniref:TRAP transporter substrate-binding protein n=1 Tax=Aequitasia blattaphilus TaxID=2949332 RepID=A0ABT1E529_9FIRM|nr:TRAP transporter substrate-binding protein [Aequitasia blattaphilus]MCP1100848.1 TRAP transporter substrate-binding protein [Aequitasia blattaphilus]MCR8613488.1 TRAP transporter substrate-binding protein [Aequitasia blattaphilus]
MNRRKIIGILGVISLLGGILMGCQKIGEAEEQRYAWPLATASTEDTVTHVFATTFAEEVERLSDGEMKITVYPQSTLGVDRELLESCKDGDIPFMVQSPATQVTFMKGLCIFDTPCIFENTEEIRAAIDQPEFQSLIQDIYVDSGYRLLGISDQNFRVMTSNKPFIGMESFKGQKIRTMENPYHLQFWKEVKANPTPMTFSEVYIGLQQGTIDAQENAYTLIDSAKIYEQQTYLIETDVVPDYTTLIISEDFFQERTEDEKEILIEAGRFAQEKTREASDERCAAKKEELQEKGMTLVPVDEETREEMREASKPVYESIKKVAGEELFHYYTGMN